MTSHSVEDEFCVWPSECEYCGIADRVLYFWRGDVWCAGCLLEACDYHGILFEGSDPTLWQTPDGKYQYGRIFNGVRPKF